VIAQSAAEEMLSSNTNVNDSTSDVCRCAGCELCMLVWTSTLYVNQTATVCASRVEAMMFVLHCDAMLTQRLPIGLRSSVGDLAKHQESATQAGLNPFGYQGLDFVGLYDTKYSDLQ